MHDVVPMFFADATWLVQNPNSTRACVVVVYSPVLLQFSGVFIESKGSFTIEISISISQPNHFSVGPSLAGTASDHSLALVPHCPVLLPL